MKVQIKRAFKSHFFVIKKTKISQGYILYFCGFLSIPLSTIFVDFSFETYILKACKLVSVYASSTKKVPADRKKFECKFWYFFNFQNPWKIF